MTRRVILHGLSRPQRTWLRRLYKEGAQFSLGTPSLRALERRGLVSSRLVNGGISRAWQLTDAGRATFDRNNAQAGAQAPELKPFVAQITIELELEADHIEAGHRKAAAIAEGLCSGRDELTLLAISIKGGE